MVTAPYGELIITPKRLKIKDLSQFAHLISLYDFTQVYSFSPHIIRAKARENDRKNRRRKI